MEFIHVEYALLKTLYRSECVFVWSLIKKKIELYCYSVCYLRRIASYRTALFDISNSRRQKVRIET